MRNTDAARLALLLACAGAGCQAPESPRDQAVERAAVLGGTPSGPEDDFVVKVASKAQIATRICTGTLLAKNLLVTAQHCVSNFDDGDFSCTSEGALTPESTYGQMGMLLDPANVAVQVGPAPDFGAPPVAYGAQIFAPQTTSICKNDIAFVVLDRDLDLPVASVRLDRGVVPGELARVVGYGETEDDFGVRYARDGVRVALVGESRFRPDGDPTPPYTLVTQGALLCIGDSGGPIFAESGALLGVFSRFTGSCMSAITRNTFTQVAPFATDAAGDAFDAAGATPVLEPPPGTGGTGGAPVEEGGAAGALGNEGGSETGGTGGAAAGTAGSAQAGAGTAGAQAGAPAEPSRRGLRQRGGCRCDVPGSTGADFGTSMSVVAAAVVALTLVRRRRAPTR